AAVGPFDGPDDRRHQDRVQGAAADQDPDGVGQGVGGAEGVGRRGHRTGQDRAEHEVPHEPQQPRDDRSRGHQHAGLQQPGPAGRHPGAAMPGDVLGAQPAAHGRSSSVSWSVDVPVSGGPGVGGGLVSSSGADRPLRASSSGSAGPRSAGARGAAPVRRARATPTTTSRLIAITTSIVVQFSQAGFTVRGTSTGSVRLRPSSVVSEEVRVTVPLAMAETGTVVSTCPRAGTSTTGCSSMCTSGRSELTWMRALMRVSRPLVTVIGTGAVSEIRLYSEAGATSIASSSVAVRSA